jgi:hypothetical protein
MNRIRRYAAVLAGALGVLVCGAAPAFAMTPVPGAGGPGDPASTPAAVRIVAAGGMPGWQIALIAVGSALVGAVAAVVASHARRRGLAAAAA